MRIALLGPTVGQTRRGYERFLTDLFRELTPRADVTLFKGAGPAQPGEVVVPHLTRTGVMERIFGARLRYRRYQAEFASFAAAMVPHLARGRFDVVHCIDPPLAAWLHQIRRVGRQPFRLLFTDAGPVSYDASAWVDHVHCLTPSAFDAAQQTAAKGRVTMLPVGVNLPALQPSAPREALRQQAGLSPHTLVVLAVTSLNRHHKRVDHLIEEVARADGNLVLWIDGSVHPDGDPALLALGKARLGQRFRHTSVPSTRVSELYALADVMVSSALHESFGMAAVEAACAGLPVAAHDSPHFRWLLGESGTRVDMSATGALSAWLTRAAAEPRVHLRRKDPAAIVQRFGWPALMAGYEEMYRRTVSGRVDLPGAVEKASAR